MKKEKNDNLKLAIFWIISFCFIAFMLFLMCFKSSASSAEYFFPMQQNENNNIPENYYTIFEQYLDTENNFVVIRNGEVFSDGLGFWYIRYPKNSNYGIYGEINNDTTHFSLYNIGANSNYENGRISITYNGDVYQNIYQQYAFTNFTDVLSSKYSNSISYISNFQIYTNNNESTRKIVLLYDDGLTIPDDDTARDDMEKPNIQDYIPDWSNKPTFDNSTVESALESVYDGIIWLGDNIKDTITGTGEYIADTVRWAIQKTINTIRSKIDEIKGVINDVKGFVSDIKDFFSYVAEPLDVSAVQTTITNSTAYGDITSITGAFSSFKSVFDNTNEPQAYTIPIHLENISILHQTTPQYIDLGVILPVRNLIRTFCWVVTTFSLFVTVVDAIPNYLKGGDE